MSMSDNAHDLAASSDSSRRQFLERVGGVAGLAAIATLPVDRAAAMMRPHVGDYPFVLGIASARTLDERPKPGDAVTNVRTLMPLQQQPPARTVTVTVTSP